MCARVYYAYKYIIYIRIIYHTASISKADHFMQEHSSLFVEGIAWD